MAPDTDLPRDARAGPVNQLRICAIPQLVPITTDPLRLMQIASRASAQRLRAMIAPSVSETPVGAAQESKVVPITSAIAKRLAS